MLTITRPISRLTYRSIRRPTHLDRYIGLVLVDMSTNISVEHRSICRPICRSHVGRYVDRYIGRGVHKIHMIQGFLYASKKRRQYVLKFSFSQNAVYVQIFNTLRKDDRHSKVLLLKLKKQIFHDGLNK